MSVTAIDQLSEQQQRAALGQFATGVCILSSRDAAGNAFGMTINSFGSVSLDPPLVLWTLDKQTVDLDRYLAGERFGVSVLAREQGALCYAFADDRLERFDGLDWDDSPGGCPVVPAAIAFFDCQIDTLHEVGDHTLVIARVTGLHAQGGEPLVFQAGKLADALPQGQLDESDSTFTDQYIGALLGRASAAFNGDFAAELPDGVKAIHWRVLACLIESSQSVNALARLVVAKQPTLTRVLDGMVDAGWVVREADNADRRRVLITATPSGRELGERVREAAQTHQSSYFKGWSQAERVTLDRFLKQVMAAPSQTRSDSGDTL